MEMFPRAGVESPSPIALGEGLGYGSFKLGARSPYAFSAPSWRPFMNQRCAIAKTISAGKMAMM